MILQVQDVLKDAMGLIGVIEIDETPSTSDMATALRVANTMIDRWSSQRLILRSSVPFEFVVTPAKSSYTIGLTGCDLTLSKPIRITSAYYRDSSLVDTPVDVITTEVYNGLTDKAISTGPILYVSYDPGYSQQSSQKGTISLYLSPDRAYTLHLELDLYLNEFTNYTDNVTFEPAYYEALIYNLAVRLFRYYNDPKIPVPQDITAIAHTSIENLKAMNSTIPLATMDLPGKISKYNIYSDGLT